MKVADLSILFEAGEFFVLARFERLGSIEEAKQILSSGPNLSRENGGILLSCEGRNARELCRFEYHDECGRWPPGANRQSLEEYLDAQLSIPEFLEQCPANWPDFCMTWFSMIECSLDNDGNFEKVITSSSEHICTPVLG